MILAVDIGGTKLHAALFEEEKLRREREVRLETQRVEAPVAALAEFVGETPVAACGVGIAGPVLGDRVDGSNLPWALSAREVSEALGEVPVRLLNDLEAAGHGLAWVGADELVTLQEGRVNPDGPRALVSPGTGLGEAIVLPDGDAWRPVPGEGGHASFAARTDEEIDLLRFLRERFGRVSVERVVSGPGLVNVFVWLRDTGRIVDDSGIEAEAGDSAPAGPIARGAEEGGSAICREALRIWVEALGAEAGNVALRGLATGGVYLGGGIPARVLPALRAGGFLRAFRDKWPQEELAARFAVRVVLNPETTLLGAASVAAALARG